MYQPSPLYAASPAMQLLEPWMQPRLPKVVEPTARQHIIQLTAGIFERQSALVATIARGSAFQANTDSSNETQVRRCEQAWSSLDLYDAAKTTRTGLSAYVRAANKR